MLKRYINTPILIILAVTLCLLFLLVHSSAHETLPDSQAPSGGYNPISVSQDGSQTTTNFSGADLQQAAPPVTGATGPTLGPSQVSP